MKVLPVILSLTVAGTFPASVLASQPTGNEWAVSSDLVFTCSSSNQSGCQPHPAEAYSPSGTHRPNFIPKLPSEEEGKYSYTQVVDPGKNQCGRVGWSSKHIGWVPQGNAQVLTKWKENHSGIACQVVGKKIKSVDKPVWMLAYTREGVTYATGLYTAEGARPMTSAGVQAFTSVHSSPWMGHALCENAEKYYGETALGPVGRMVNGHGFLTLSTGERVPVTSFMVSYVKTHYFGNSKRSEWRKPICEVLRADLRYAPKYQDKYAKVDVKVDTHSGSTLVRQDY